MLDVQALYDALKANLLTPPSYTFDAGMRVYRDSRGRFASFRVVYTLLDSSTEGNIDVMKNLSIALARGELPAPAWYMAMQNQLRRMHVQNAALAAGGYEQLLPRDFRRIDEMLRSDMDRLLAFGAQIQAGLQSDAQIKNRVNMYVGTARRQFYMSLRSPENAFDEVTIERRVLRPADHCSWCVYLSELGWQPYGTLPMPGDSSPTWPDDQCLSNCRCDLERKTVKREELLDIFKDSKRPYWLGGVMPMKAWNEAEHPRHPAGSEHGGQFAPANAAGVSGDLEAERAEMKIQTGNFAPSDIPAEHISDWASMTAGKADLSHYSAKVNAATLRILEVMAPSALKIQELREQWRSGPTPDLSDSAALDEAAQKRADLNKRVDRIEGVMAANVKKALAAIVPNSFANADMSEMTFKERVKVIAEERLKKVAGRDGMVSSFPSRHERDLAETMAELVAVMDWSVNFPAEVEFAIESGDGRESVDENGVIHYYTEREGGSSVHWHELGHMIENYNPGIERANRDFLQRRARKDEAGQSVTEPMNNLVPWGRYAADEIAYRDRWFNPYVGKIYEDGATEVTSMGLQALGSRPIDLVKDPEHLAHTLAALFGEFNE